MSDEQETFNRDQILAGLVESPQALLARLDERTKDMATNIAAIKTSIDTCIKPQCAAHRTQLAKHDTEIALLKNNWKIMVGVTSAIVAFATWAADHLIPS